MSDVSSTGATSGSSSGPGSGSGFEGRVVLVTGGASGIGRASAEAFARLGASVMVADRDEVHGDVVVAAIRAAGGEARFVRVDVAEPDQIRAMVDAVEEEYGRLDVAVNNAGMPGTYKAFSDQLLDDWQRTLAVNLTGVFLSMQAEIPAMLDVGRGAIVNVSSAAGLMGFANLPAYVASKHGVIGLTKSVALEYARQDIRINAVCPGNIHTPMLLGFAGGDEETLQGMGKLTPMGRLGTPAEIAESIVWLCSDAASYVTGHAMAVDGGVLAT
jgi:NAD(P)-dependent dehydrogenase (short-subunit alcohol dehydrogenase family)